MMKIPDKSEFGGKGKIPEKLTQNEYLNLMKSNGCANCHSQGVRAMRTFPQNVPHPFPPFKNSEEAWFRRIQSGQGGVTMFNNVVKELGGAPIKYFADWTDRIAKGELPHAQPPRPQGIERNLVITEWDWGWPDKYLHDLISTDKRNPIVNAGGKEYGSPEYAGDDLPILDPATNTVTVFHPPVRDPGMPLSLGEGHAATEKPAMPSAYWGDRQIWDTPGDEVLTLMKQRFTEFC